MAAETFFVTVPMKKKRANQNDALNKELKKLGVELMSNERFEIKDQTREDTDLLKSYFFGAVDPHSNPGNLLIPQTSFWHNTEQRLVLCYMGEGDHGLPLWDVDSKVPRYVLDEEGIMVGVIITLSYKRPDETEGMPVVEEVSYEEMMKKLAEESLD